MTTWYGAGICIKHARIKLNTPESPLPDGKADEFVAATRASLDAIRRTPMGAQLLTEIGNSGRVISIYRAWDIDTGNSADREDVIDSMVVPLDWEHDDGRTELGVVLDRACHDTSGRSKVKRLLGIGQARPRFVDRDALARLVHVSPRELKAMESGSRLIDPSTDARLKAYLYDFLTPGKGSNGHVCFNHVKLNLSQGHELFLPSYRNWRDRPLPVALAHELVHAWRIATGRVLFEYGWEEEAMTVGLPPFSTMKFTENRFRIEFDKSGLAVRPDYQYAKFMTDLVTPKQLGVDPDNKAWLGKRTKLAAPNPNRDAVHAEILKRRAVMAFDDDGFDA